MTRTDYQGLIKNCLKISKNVRNASNNVRKSSVYLRQSSVIFGNPWKSSGNSPIFGRLRMILENLR